MSHNDNNFNEWANVSLMNDEDIDYTLIPEAVLQELALGNELYIATSALVELWMRESYRITPFAPIAVNFAQLLLHLAEPEPEIRRVWLSEPVER